VFGFQELDIRFHCHLPYAEKWRPNGQACASGMSCIVVLRPNQNSFFHSLAQRTPCSPEMCLCSTNQFVKVENRHTNCPVTRFTKSTFPEFAAAIQRHRLELDKIEVSILVERDSDCDSRSLTTRLIHIGVASKRTSWTEAVEARHVRPRDACRRRSRRSPEAEAIMPRLIIDFVI
jgi:hypothetical protein